MNHSIRQAAENYLELDYEAIPLNPRSKYPLLAGWKNTDPVTQWENAPGDSNVGLRCGGSRRLCVLDSDDKKRPTWQNIFSLLCGLGLEPGSYPTIITPNGGRHVYLELRGILPGNLRIFTQEFGAGEFRYGPGALVAAPPSEILDGCYIQEAGDLRELPKIEPRDIISILENADSTTIQKPQREPKLSRRALALLQGNGIENYSTRSEAEQAILDSLVRSGFEFEDALSLFLQYPAAGKFHELYQRNQKAAIRWLSESFKKAQEWTQANESPARKVAQTELEWAKSQPWPGRTGSTDRSIYIAHASIARRAARFTYAAGSRTLAELAGTSRPTAEKATRRLRQAGLIQLDKPAAATCATVYRLVMHDLSTSYKDCDEVDKGCITGYDVFRMAGLGKAAGEVYQLLRKRALTVKELTERTGRHRVTIRRALNRMSKLVDVRTGEIVSMVVMEGDKCRGMDVDLDYMAQIVGTAGTLDRQKQKHAKERAAHRISLELGSKKAKADE